MSIIKYNFTFLISLMTTWQKKNKRQQKIVIVSSLNRLECVEIAGCRGTNTSPLVRDKTLQTRVGSIELRIARTENERERQTEKRREDKRKREGGRGVENI